jgi:hypothetical protein
MKSVINNVVKIMATGFVVLTLLSLPLFWVRWLCETTLLNILADMMPHYARKLDFYPSGLVPPEQEGQVYRSSVKARMKPENTLFIGIVDYFEARKLGGRHSNTLYYDKYDKYNDNWMYFDEKTGQIACHYTYRQKISDSTVPPKKIRLYAGPEAVSATLDETADGFIDPIIDRSTFNLEQERSRELILYDRKLHRFFKINFNQRTVVKGPQLNGDDIHKPVQIGELSKNPSLLPCLQWQPPLIRAPGSELKPITPTGSGFDAGLYLLVLDKSGRIDLLDRDKLEFAGAAGHLPAPPSLYPSRKFVTPKDLLSYNVLPIAFDTGNRYRGMFVASVCREGTAMELAVFNEKGELVKEDYTWSSLYGSIYDSRHEDTTPSSKAVFFAVPGAPALTIAKWLLENVHAPILSLISYFTAYSFEAGAGHRALFILPNSFVAMKGRDVRQGIAERLHRAVLIVLPSIMFVIFLAWRVSKDATAVGLSQNARLFWMIGTIAFGLAGYITYRLTRPKEPLVTCANCGKLRRPDMDRCHRCGSRWHVPEITAPAWRIVDNG